MQTTAATATIENVRRSGPARVIVSEEGEAVPASRAKGPVDFILVRKDGWSIGGPKRLYETARALWEKEWLAVIVRPGPSTEVTIWFPQAA